MFRCSLVLALSALQLRSSLVGAQNASLLSVEWKTGNARIDRLVEQLTPEEKISLVHGSQVAFADPGNQDQAGYVVPIPRLNIPAVRLSDGEAGLNVVYNATAFPMELNVAATWSRSAAYDSGVVKGREAKILDMNIALFPRVNILRDPVAGNFWQSYSEDPFLNAQLGVQGVHGCQDQGTMANPKQIGPSSTGASGDDTNSIVDMQTLQEVYWSAPGALLEAGAATAMCSYARVNGVPACQYQPLFDTVRGIYNSSAIVMSDWTATHSTEESIVAGLDWEMPAAVYFGEILYDSVYVTKNISETYINRALGIILNQYGAFGLLDGNQTNVTSQIQEDVKLADAAIAYDIAVRSGVLLKNNDQALPLANNESFAVIGPNGLQYSHGTNFAERAYGFPDREVSPLDAILSRTGRSDVPTAVGVDQEGSLIPSSALQSLNSTQGLSRNDSMGGFAVDSTVNFSGDSALPANRDHEWQGYLDAPTTGLYTISLQRKPPSPAGKVNSDYGVAFDTATLSINGSEDGIGYRLLGDGGIRPWSNSIATRDGWDNIKATVYLTASQHSISASIISELGEPVDVRLCWVTPEQRERNLRAAVDVASSVETPILFAFANSPAQVAMTLDDDMDELVKRVAAANPKTVLVLNNAEPVMMPWLDDVAAVLEMMYAGQEGGWATADLLFGRHTPQGKLPVTYPVSVNQSVTHDPSYPGRVGPAGGNATFSEGVNSGYRWYKFANIPVLFPFGYGLSYTTFNYSNLSFHQSAACDVAFSVSFNIENTGRTDGAEVPQVYVGPPADANPTYHGVQFASITLVGFDSVDIAAGKSAHVEIPVMEKQLSFFNVTSGAFQLAKGKRDVWVGKNAEEYMLTGSTVIH